MAIPTPSDLMLKLADMLHRPKMPERDVHPLIDSALHNYLGSAVRAFDIPEGVRRMLTPGPLDEPMAHGKQGADLNKLVQDILYAGRGLHHLIPGLHDALDSLFGGHLQRRGLAYDDPQGLGMRAIIDPSSNRYVTPTGQEAGVMKMLERLRGLGQQGKALAETYHLHGKNLAAFPFAWADQNTIEEHANSRDAVAARRAHEYQATELALRGLPRLFGANGLVPVPGRDSPRSYPLAGYRPVSLQHLMESLPSSLTLAQQDLDRHWSDLAHGETGRASSFYNLIQNLAQNAKINDKDAVVPAASGDVARVIGEQSARRSETARDRVRDLKES